MRKNKQIIFIFTMFLISIIFVGLTDGKQIIKNDKKDQNNIESSNMLATLSYYPEYHDFGEINRGDVANTTFEIWNSGCCSLSYSLYENEDWVDVHPTSGFSIKEHDIITVDIDTSDLTKGEHICDIIIESTAGDGVFTIFVNVIYGGITDITVEQAWNMLSDTSNGIQIPIDVRTDGEWKTEHIDTPYPEHPRHHNYIQWNDPDNLDEFLTTYEGKELIIYCKSGGRSRSAADILFENEFNGIIYNMLGGITEWKNQGYPIEGHTELEFLGVQGEIGAVAINIKNNGSYTAKNISTTINVTGGFLSAIDITHTCDCDTPLDPKAIKIESTSKGGTIFGIGPIEITAMVSAKNADEITMVKEGFVIGVFILIR